MKANLASAAGMHLDNVILALLVLPSVAEPAPREGVQFLNRGFGNRKRLALRVDQVECLAIAPHLFFVAIAQCFLAEHDGANPLVIDFHAFNPIRGYGTFDQGMFTQRFELLWGLLREQFLLTQCLRHVRKIPGRPGGNGRRLFEELSERHHTATSPLISRGNSRSRAARSFSCTIVKLSKQPSTWRLGEFL